MSDAETPLVALISATPLAIPPVEHAFSGLYPEARIWNILDDRLLKDADERGGVTPKLRERMVRLIDHAQIEGADAILLTCSMYGFVAQELSSTLDIPIYGPDDAAFEALLGSSLGTVALVSSLELTLADSRARLSEAARARGAAIEIVPVYSADALAASREGDVVALVATLSKSIVASGVPVDGVILAQYSLAPAMAGIERDLGVAVFSGPERSAIAVHEALSSAAR